MFRKGDMVVHPRHGAAVVEDLVELEKFGEQRVYVKLRLPKGLTLMVPVESTEQIGLRGVVSRDELDEVFDLLRGDEGFMPIPLGQEVQGEPSQAHVRRHLPRGRGRPEPLL